MLSGIVRWCLTRPWLVVAAGFGLIVLGILSLRQARFDVFPEFVPAQVEVQTEASGFSAEQVERLVTLPIERSLAGGQGVDSVRSQSMPGLSIITVLFQDHADPYRARQIVSESLSEALAQLPAGVKAPRVAPLTSSTMDLLKIGFTSDRLSAQALRERIVYLVRPKLLAVHGVARATLYGGQAPRIEVRVRPEDLAAQGLTLDDIQTAIRSVSTGAGGGFIDTPQQRLLMDVPSPSLGVAQIAGARISGPGNGALTVADIGTIDLGSAPATGDALIMGKPGVLLSLSSQYGANTLETTHALERVLAELKPALQAQGIKVYANLHRPANFIEVALKGLFSDIAIGAALIAIVLSLFLRDPRAVAVSFVSIPLSLLISVMVFTSLNWTIDTMTLGGLAVALGVIVDDAVIDVENIARRLRQAKDSDSELDIILAASLEVRAPVIYATLVVAMTLLPVLALRGVQGAFFAPLAGAFIVATLASLFVAIVFTPALAKLTLAQTSLPEEPQWLLNFKRWQSSQLALMFGRPRAVLFSIGLAMIMVIASLTLLKSELLPSFKEGHYVIGLKAPPGTSLAVMKAYGQSLTRDLLQIKGIATVEQQIGRAEGGEDSWGSNQAEMHVELSPALSAARQSAVNEQIDHILEAYPALTTEVQTFLGDRLGESVTGETAALAVNLYGDDLDQMDQVAARAAAIMSAIPGARAVSIQTPEPAPSVRVDFDLPSLSRLGVSPQAAMETLRAATEGTNVIELIEGLQSKSVVVTFPRDLTQDPEGLGNLLLKGQQGEIAQLREVATIRSGAARSVIAHEDGQRRVVITANPIPSDVKVYSESVRKTLAAKLKPPAGTIWTVIGTAEAESRARQDLLINGAIAFAGLVALLLMAFSDGRSVVLLLVTSPVALLGGVLAVFVSGAVLSLGSLVGFVTLFGISIRNAILLLSHARQLEQETGSWSEAILKRAVQERTTPILMTTLVTALGLLPLALQTGEAGREIQGPMAIVILGGLVTAMLSSLWLFPSVIWRFYRPKAVPQTSRL